MAIDPLVTRRRRADPAVAAPRSTVATCEVQRAFSAVAEVRSPPPPTPRAGVRIRTIASSAARCGRRAGLPPRIAANASPSPEDGAAAAVRDNRRVGAPSLATSTPGRLAHIAHAGQRLLFPVENANGFGRFHMRASSSESLVSGRSAPSRALALMTPAGDAVGLERGEERVGVGVGDSGLSSRPVVSGGADVLTYSSGGVAQTRAPVG